MTVLALALVVFAIAGGPSSTSRTVTVVTTRVLPSTGAAFRGASVSARSVYEADAPGVVFVNASNETKSPSAAEYLKGEGAAEPATATGSGFELDGQGTILTNWHVVQGATKVTVGLGPGNTVAASVIADNPSLDIAVLRIPTGGLILHPLALGRSSMVHVGDPALAIGNPFGLARTLTSGLISALDRKITAPNGLTIANAMQTDAAINPGNSGGPLLNEHGQVIGINSQIETSGSGGGSVGIAFAVPIDAVKHYLSTLGARPGHP